MPDLNIIAWTKNRWDDDYTPKLCRTQADIVEALAAGEKVILTQPVTIDVSVSVKPSADIPQDLVPKLVAEKLEAVAQVSPGADDVAF